MTSPPALHAHGLHKRYGHTKALNGVDITLLPGQFHVLLGPNGAGKSTLLQLLTGLFNPDQGQIEVCGVSMAQRPAQALARLGVVFQQSALDLDLSVRANLLFHTDLHGLPRREAMARIESLLPTLGLSDQLSATVRTLSGGNRRKVELVRALLHRPAVLLMDEATVGLDPASRQQLLHTVHRLCREQGTAVLWATHLLEEAEEADHLLLLARGEVCYAGTVANFVASHGGADFRQVAMGVLGV
jgi:ABC-2 type transport system ATP-binding protein